jgi:NAD(P)-dependent dehydrogenase (short-subunit alcohol dehydrogenase family)/acyl dehydratase
VKRILSVTHEQLWRFAEASGDRNPLHVDELFARGTPFGRCIAQGALVTVAALGITNETTLRSVGTLDAQFKQPVFPDEEYTISLVDSDPGKTRIEVGGRGRVAVNVTLTTHLAAAPFPAASKQEPLGHGTSPRPYTLDDLVDADVSLTERYGCELGPLSALAADLGAEHVPDSMLVWLSAASYTVGMLVPGRDAVFAGARIVRASAVNSGTLTASLSAADDRTGLVIVDAAVDQGEASAQMTLQTFLRPVVPAPDRSSIGRYLPPSTELSGRNILIVGASRGLGAALSGAFATQGATVWAGFARSTKHGEKLRSDFGSESVRLLQFDAEDTEQTRRAFNTLRTQAGALDGVVFCAAPPLYEMAFQPEATEATLRSLRSSLAMVLTPLTESLHVLSPDGWLIVMSSSALDDPPEAWPHYVTAKAALEGLAAYCARHTRARVLIIRAPKMWTDSTNTPLGRIGAVAKEQVAAAIARWVMRGELSSEEHSSRPLLVTAEELLEAAPDPESPSV